MDLKELGELGLSKGQVKVYSAILSLGVASINQIQQKTGLERRGIYDIVGKLVDKGLISYTIERGKKSYQCTNPNKILEEIEEKEKELQALREKVPKVKDMMNLHSGEIRVEVYRGNEGLKSFLHEVLEHKQSYWLGGNNFNQMKDVSESTVMIFQKWMQKRIKEKHLMNDLIDYGAVLKGLVPDSIKQQKKDYMKICRMPKDLTSPVVIVIFGDKVAQILWSKQTHIIITKSKDLADSFKAYFNYFWKEPW